MDGLECNESNLSEIINNKDYRIDSQFWTTKIHKNSNHRYLKIGKILEKTQYGISIEMNEDKIGCPIFRMNEIHNMLCDLNVKKYAKISEKELDEFKLKDGDVLFNRTNSFEWVGRTGIYYSNGNYDKQVFASYLVRLIVDETQVLPEYLVAFLNSSSGVKQIKARARQSINQTNVNPEEVKEIEIPVLSMRFQKIVQDQFLLANDKRLKSAKLYEEAEELLDRYLNISDLSQEKAINIVSLSQSMQLSGRLDAEYYQPKYATLLRILKKLTTKNLGGANGIVSIKKSIEPGSEAYQDEGIPFIRVSDVDNFGISQTSIKLSQDIVPNVERLYPTKDTILLSKDGSVGIAYKVAEDMKVVTSGALLHLTVKDQSQVLPDYLTLILNSPIGQLQAERDCNGAIIQHWKPNDIEKVLIPILDMNKQKEIADKVQKSFKLRRESERLLDIAKQAVEIAIETDEDTALSWLNNGAQMSCE